MGYSEFFFFNEQSSFPVSGLTEEDRKTPIPMAVPLHRDALSYHPLDRLCSPSVSKENFQRLATIPKTRHQPFTSKDCISTVKTCYLDLLVGGNVNWSPQSNHIHETYDERTQHDVRRNLRCPSPKGGWYRSLFSTNHIARSQRRPFRPSPLKACCNSIYPTPEQCLAPHPSHRL